MKKRILAATLLVVVSFTGVLAISEYRQCALIVIHYKMTEHNDDGTTYEWSKSVRVFNRQGEWTETQFFPDGKLMTASGNVTPRYDRFTLFPDAPRKEILGRTVLVLFDRRTEAWYDPSTDQILKDIIYADDTRQTVHYVIEAVEIKE